MKITKHLILSSTALCCAINISSISQAQTEPEPMFISRVAIAALERVKDANEKCKNGTMSYQAYDDIMNSYRAGLSMKTYDMGREQKERFERDNPVYKACPPITKTTQSQDTGSTSNVRLSGYGRFGLDYNDANATDSDEPTDDNSTLTSRLRLKAGITQVFAPQAGYGVRFLTASEKFIAKTDDSLTGYTIGGSFSPSRTYLENNLEVGMEYTHAKGTSEASVANGTDGVGIVYHDRAPNDSTGLGLGPRGMDVKTKSITDRLRIQIDMGSKTDGGVSFGSRVRLGGGVEFTDTKHEASVTTPSFNNISSTSSQDLYEAYFFGSLSSRLPLTPSTNSISLILTPMLELGYRHAKLGSEQHNVCGLCGPAEQDFRINIRDDDGGVYFGGRLSGELGYQISDTTKIGLSANIGYRSHAAEIINPETGDDLFIRNNPTHLESDSEYSMGIEAIMSASF